MSNSDNPDVIIVGAGMAGAAIADVLVRAGAKVLCLEQGPFVHAVDHPTFTDDWEFSVRRDWAFTPNLRKQPYDFPVPNNGTFMPYLYNAVGGSTNHYSAFWHRLKPVDFRKGTEHGIEDTIDWPITYEDLAPYYDQNDADMGVSGITGDLAYPPRPDRRGSAATPRRVLQPDLRGAEQAQRALVARRQRHRDRRPRRAVGVQRLWHVQPGLPTPVAGHRHGGLPAFRHGARAGPAGFVPGDPGEH